jgi:hypothetical protein
VARGNEKGHVESLVGHHWSNFLVPVPSFTRFAELNAYLARRCEEELYRTSRGHSEFKRQRLETARQCWGSPGPPSSRARTLSRKLTRGPWFTFLATSTRPPRPKRTRVSSSSVTSRQLNSWPRDTWWRRIGVSGRRPSLSMNPFTTWCCSSVSPAPSTRPAFSRTGSCWRASGRCTAASRLSWGPGGVEDYIKVLGLLER